MSNNLYTIIEAALKLGLSALTVRRAIKSGRIRAVRVGDKGKYLIPEEALNAYLQPVEVNEGEYEVN
jgi:excisionase family DNA binding protein